MRRALIYVWDNPAIIGSCLQLARTLDRLGLPSLFVTPGTSRKDQITKEGFGHVSFDALRMECGGDKKEWLEDPEHTPFQERSHRGVNLFRESGYERFCLSHGYSFPLGENLSVLTVLGHTYCCVEGFFRLIEQYEPKVCFVWNGLILPPRALRTVCRSAGIPVFSLERGLLPGFLVVDQEGINYAGTLGGPRWDLMKPFFPLPDPGEAEEYVTRFGAQRLSVVNKGVKLDAGALRAHLGIPFSARVILIPNQIDADTNIVYFSKNYPTNRDVITEVAEALKDRSDIFLVVKAHPEDGEDRLHEYEKILLERGRVARDVHLHSLIDLADLVVVRNSTVGLEGLLLGKPVVCLGHSAYTGKGFTCDVEERSALKDVINRALSEEGPFPPNRHAFLSYLSCLLRGYHFDLSGREGADAYNEAFLARAMDSYGEKDVNLRKAEKEKEDAGLAGVFRVVAIISAHNEGDVIYHVIGALINDGVAVYLMDHNSDDDTVSEASKWLGKGLIGIERFSGGPADRPGEKDLYEWGNILKRKESLALELDADWFIHHDADEFRESPWPGVSLCDAIRKVDKLGYNAIDFALFNFRPTDDSFRSGADVRDYLRYCEPGEVFDKVQIKAWKRQPPGVDLESTGGHEVRFEGRKVFPIKFILRHYPVRSSYHGEKKVFRERKPRFLRSELARGWHVQYEGMNEGHDFLFDPAELALYDGDKVRLEILGASADVVVPASARQETILYVKELEREIVLLEERLEEVLLSRGWRVLTLWYRVRDAIFSRGGKAGKSG